MGIRPYCLLSLLWLWSGNVFALSLIWETVELPTDAYLNDIFATESGFVAVGSEGTVLHSSNGRHWSMVPIPVQEHVGSGVDFSGRWVVAGFSTGIWYSDDRGRNWRQSTIPQVDDREFRPFQVEVLHGRLLVFGYLENTCIIGVAKSEDGVLWQADYTGLFGFASKIAVSPYGAVTQTSVSGPPCVVQPQLGPPDVFYTPDPTNWREAAHIGDIAMRDSGLHGYLWLDDRLLATSESWNTFPVQLEYWVRELSPGQSLSEADPVILDSRPLRIGRYGDKPLVVHQGAISIRDENGVWNEQPLPVDNIFIFAEHRQTLVGIGPRGMAIRGVSPFAFPVPAATWPGLVLLAILFLGIAARQLPTFTRKR